MTKNLFFVTCAATIITSALKAAHMQCWISATDNKVSAGAKSPLREEKDQANLRKVSGLLEPACQKHHLSVSPNYIVQFGDICAAVLQNV